MPLASTWWVQSTIKLFCTFLCISSVLLINLSNINLFFWELPKKIRKCRGSNSGIWVHKRERYLCAILPLPCSVFLGFQWLSQFRRVICFTAINCIYNWSTFWSVSHYFCLAPKTSSTSLSFSKCLCLYLPDHHSLLSSQQGFCVRLVSSTLGTSWVSSGHLSSLNFYLMIRHSHCLAIAASGLIF